MTSRPSPISSTLPPPRRRRGIKWTRLIARVLCAVFGLIGLFPIAATVVARSAMLNAWATRESSRFLEQQGLHANYTIQVKLVPLALELTDVRLDASDGLGPALTSDRISARPRIFALLAGKLVIDQIEIDEPAIRLVIKDGELQNLPIRIPKGDGQKHPLRAPFSVLAVTGASVDLHVDGAHLTAREIDVDLTTDEAGPEGSSFEIATRIGKATFSRPRVYRPAAGKGGALPPSLETFDDDALCTLDARVRYEPHLVTVRRFSAEGAADLDGAPDTPPPCGLPATDKRRVEIALNHLRIAFPEGAALPRVDGHARLRAPIRLAERAASLPETDGWIGFDADVRYDESTTIPEIDGHFEAHDVRLMQYRFAREIQADLAVHKNVVRAPKITVGIAEGLATLSDVQVEPLGKGIPLKARFDASGVSFTALMRDLGISDHAHVTWDVRELYVPLFKGTLFPLHIDGDMTGHTANFVVADRAIDDPSHARLLGFHEASLASHVAVRPTTLEFQAVHSVVGKSVIDDGLCAIGFDNHLRVDAPKSSIDLADITPLGDIPLAGQAEAEVHVSGLFSDPHLEADAQIAGFSLGDIPFGSVTGGHVSFQGTAVDLKNVRAVKGKSQYELPQARLEFGGKAKMELDGVATTGAMGLRDFLAIWKMDDDPRFDDLDAQLATRASIHLAMGGAEDACGGGLVDVRAGVHATQLKLYGEQFDDGDADLEFRQFDRRASMQGTDVTVRALTLHKYHPQGKEPSGSILGSGRIARGGVLHASVVMEAIPLFRVQALGALRSQTEGAVSGIAMVDGTLDEFGVTSDLDVTPIRIRGTPLGSSHLHVHATQTNAGSPGARSAGKTPCGNPVAPPFDKEAYLTDTSQRGEITVDGDVAGGALHFDHLAVTRTPKPVVTGMVTLKDLDLGALTRVLTPADKETPEDLAAPEGAPKDELEGAVSGVLAIERAQVGAFDHAKIRFSPAALTVARGAERMVMRPTTDVIALEEDRVTIPPLVLDLQAARGLRGAVTLRGSVGHATRDPELALGMDLSPIDLGLLVGVVPRLERATGTLQGSVKLGGKLGAPSVSGDVHVAGGELSVKGLPSIVSDLNVDLRAGAEELRIVQATARFGGGTLMMRGGVPLKQLFEGVGEAQLSARGIHLSPADGVTATVDADVTLALNAASSQGALARLPRITGDVIVTQFEYARPINLTTDLSAFGVRAKRTVVETYDPSLDALSFELRLRAHAPLRIRNNLIEAQLGLESDALTVSGTNQRVGLRGDLKALPSGRFHLRGNDFDVRQALIRFDDPTRIAPNVDVVAVTEYRRYTDTAASSAAGASGTGAGITAGGGSGTVWRITLHAYGDADNLRLEMTSDPPLSQEDIVLLLTIGMTRAEVDQLQASSLGASAALEALATVSGADKAVKQAIPIIDDFRFGSAYSPRSGKTEPQVTVGKRLTENVRASVSSGLTSDSDREVRSNVEWRLNQRLSVRGSYDNINDVSSTVGNVGVDLRWRLEFE
jgi:translocation and assembly module TamB